MGLGIVRTAWSGNVGGPGLTQLAVSNGTALEWSTTEAQGAVDAVRTFWGTVATYIPSGVTLSVQSAVDQYDDATGLLIGTVTAPTSPTTVNGSAAGNWAAAAGFKIDWDTGAIANGRRIRGKTYVVPAAACFESNGTLSSTAITSVTGSANTLLANLQTAGLWLGVWSRPKIQGDGTGGVFQVSGASVKDKSAVLRSRRD